MDAPSADAPGVDSPGADAGVDAPGMDAPGMDASPDSPTCGDPCLLASGLDHPFLMTSDAQNVYWTEFGDTGGSGNGSVKGCPTSGCGAGPKVYAQGLTNPRGLAVDTTSIYFGTATYGGVTGGIWRCPLTGCGGGPTLVAPAVIPYGLAVDATYLYWVDFDDNTVRKVATATASTPVILYDGGAVDDAGTTLAELAQVVVDGPYLFIGARTEDLIRLSVNGYAPVILGNSVNGGVYGAGFGVTTDSTRAYMGGNGIVMGADKLTGDSGVAVVNGVNSALGLAYDSASGLIYWANFGSGNSNDGTVGKFGNDGGAKQVLQASLTTPEAIALSGNYVLWVSSGTLLGTNGTNPSTGALWRTAK